MTLNNRTQAVTLLLQVLLEAKKISAQKLTVEARDPAEQDCAVIAESAGQQKRLKTISRGEAESLLMCLRERACAWPDRTDVLFETNRQQVPRLLFAPLSSFRLLADLSTPRPAERDNASLTLDNICWEGISPITDMLVLAEDCRRAILNAARNKSGLILASRSKDPALPHAAAVFLALRPDAVYLPQCDTGQSAQEALQRASSSLVVVGCPGLDPVDMIYNFFDTYFPDEAQYADAAKKLLLSFIHVRVKRTCAACTKSTSVTPANIERLPEVLRVLAQDTYMFSRGCPKCGNSAYRGTIGLNSAAGITADLQQVLTDRAGAEAFTQAAYQNGTRTILEDGLQKIYSGLTSFEQVFSVVSTISPAFALAAARTAEAAKKASPAAERPLDPNTEPPSSPSRRQRRKVLIVEDEVEQRDVLRIVFEKEGYTVVPADNGKHALEILAGQSVDAILCDVMMPVMNGFDFVKALRENPTYQRTPVLMLTAANSADDEVALLSLGADDYCGKNLKRKILLQRVERVLERKRPDNPVGHLLEDDE